MDNDSVKENGDVTEEGVLQLIEPIKLFVFAFVALWVVSAIMGGFLSTGLQDFMLVLLIAAFGTLVYQILHKGQSLVKPVARKPRKDDKDDEEEDGVPEEQLDNTPFGWVNAMQCDEVQREDKRSQCENDGFTLHQQLGGFGDWVETNPGDRQVYVKDYKRLRRDRCNLFQREDLQTACKLEPHGDF